ncbi:MAG: hypothetical protein O7G88_18215 [bacterium]|nr:hypothetical protein [bacterium]
MIFYVPLEAILTFGTALLVMHTAIALSIRQGIFSTNYHPMA